MENFDVVIIGAGSAGCILANKIINNTNYNVLLLEAGPKDNSLVVDVPLGYGMTFYNKKINWNFYSKKQKNLFNREIYYPRGKVLGGSGSINAMVYARGLESDYKNWSENEDWSLKNIINSFENIEEQTDIAKKNLSSNKIPVNDVSKLHHPILNYFFEGCKDLKIPFNKNLNTNIDNQVGHYNINTFKGTRHSSSKVFLKPILKNNRLYLKTNSIVKKLIIKDKKIDEIHFNSNNKEFKIKPNIGAVLCAGSIMNPFILMHSGIGDPEKLQSMQKQVVIENQNVGKNLQDHLGLDYLFKSSHPSLNRSLGRWTGRVKSVFNYLYNKQGPFSLSINQSGGYINWNSKHNYPNLQIYFNPLTYSVSHKNKRPLLKTDKFDGFIIGFNSCRPKSLGSISLSSPYIEDSPIIDPNFLTHEEDIHDVKCAINFSKTLAETFPIKKIRMESVNNNLIKASESEMLDHFKKNAVSIYHPCGTCKMNNDQTKGVVSERMKMHGLHNLWILDASVFPNITSGNINAPVMMLANLGSKIIIEDLKKQ